MRRLSLQIVTVIMSELFGFAAASCRAEQLACANLSVLSSVAAGGEELILADLLPSDACPRMRKAASRVSLGKTPRAGAVRVFEGSQLRLLIETLASNHNFAPAASLRIPERVVVRRAGAMKSCAEIADFLASAALSRDAGSSRSRRENLECGAAQGISEAAQLEVIKADWNGALQRWEFLLRCARSEECVPFLVSAREQKARHSEESGEESAVAFAESSAAQHDAQNTVLSLLVKPGDTALLTWDQAGIRVVLPVTCLDAGGLGQSVRVRFKNTPRILRAEVVGNRAVQVRL